MGLSGLLKKPATGQNGDERLQDQPEADGQKRAKTSMRLIQTHQSPASAPFTGGGQKAMREAFGRPSASMGAALMTLDILSLFMAAGLASLITLFVQEHILHTTPYTALTDEGQRRNLYAVLCMVQLAMMWSKGLYACRVPWWSQVQYIGKVVLFTCLIDGFLSFALKIYESRLLIATTWLGVFGFTVSLRWLGCRMAARLGLWQIPTVIIGDNATATDLMYAFAADPCAGYNVHTIFLRDRDAHVFDVTNLPRECRHICVREGLPDYDAYIRENPGTFYVVSLDAFRGETRDQLIGALDSVRAAYAIVPTISKVGVYEMEPRYFFGHDIMLLQPRTPAPFPVTKVAKRGLDIAVSGLALLALSPLFLAVAAMLRLEGQGGSIFYGGKRIGKNGRKFGCWKFRSMEPDSDHLLHAYLDANPDAKADWEKYRKLPNDPRVTTKTARFIRKASIDELPQLWNVLAGDMSLVGPRPILEDEIPYFGDALKDYLSVRPGLTGLWQVSGRNATSFMRRVYWDSWYVRNWSLWGDIVILIKTPLVLLSRKGAH